MSPKKSSPVKTLKAGESTHEERWTDCFCHLVPLSKAAAAGDMNATICLMRIANWATRLLGSVYTQQPGKVKTAALQEARQTGGEFPALCSWRKEGEAARKNMLADLNLGSVSILKVGLKRQTPTWRVIHDIIIPMLRFQQAEGKLPSLTKQTVNEWVKAAESYFLPAGTDATKNDWVCRIARPERALGKRKAKSRSAITKRFGRGELDPIAETKLQVHSKKIDALKITDAEVRNGFRESLAVTLRSNLKE